MRQLIGESKSKVKSQKSKVKSQKSKAKIQKSKGLSLSTFQALAFNHSL